MGIIVAVFSLLSINYQAFSQAKLDYKYIITMNLTLVLCIVVLMGLILIFINKAKEKSFYLFFIFSNPLETSYLNLFPIFAP